jgi:hypothetical protein
MPVPDFSPGEVLTAAAMDRIGLWLVKSQTFTGSGTVQLTNVFSNLYNNYMLTFVCDTAPAGAAIVNASMLVGTTPNNTAASYNYYESGNTWAGTADNTAGASATSWFAIRSAQYFMGTMQIQNPFRSVYTTFQSSGIDATQSWQSRGQQILNNSYDGIQFSHAGGNLNGFTVNCYGYRN